MWGKTGMWRKKHSHRPTPWSTPALTDSINKWRRKSQISTEGHSTMTASTTCSSNMRRKMLMMIHKVRVTDFKRDSHIISDIVCRKLILVSKWENSSNSFILQNCQFLLNPICWSFSNIYSPCFKCLYYYRKKNIRMDSSDNPISQSFDFYNLQKHPEKEAD